MRDACAAAAAAPSALEYSSPTAVRTCLECVCYGGDKQETSLALHWKPAHHATNTPLPTLRGRMKLQPGVFPVSVLGFWGKMPNAGTMSIPSTRIVGKNTMSYASTMAYRRDLPSTTNI